MNGVVVHHGLVVFVW